MCCEAPRGWLDYGTEGETAPDVQPGSFEVDLPAQDGTTYVSLVTRDNDTKEGLIQQLSQPLKAGETYQFSISLARSPIMISLSRTTGEEINYNGPVRFVVGGTTSIQGTMEILAESSIVEHTTWKPYDFTFSPTVDMTYITLMVDWGILPATNGNILMDNCSEIVRVKTETQD